MSDETTCNVEPHTPKLDAAEIRRRIYNLTVPARNWWAGAFGRRAAFIEGRDIALANAAMVAYDMGRPDIRERINSLCERGK